jgi:hypothetical protein
VIPKILVHKLHRTALYECLVEEEQEMRNWRYPADRKAPPGLSTGGAFRENKRNVKILDEKRHRESRGDR